MSVYRCAYAMLDNQYIVNIRTNTSRISKVRAPFERRFKCAQYEPSNIRIHPANSPVPKSTEKAQACSAPGTYRIFKLKSESNSTYLKTPEHSCSPKSHRGNALYQDVLLVMLPAHPCSGPNLAVFGPRKRWRTCPYINRTGMQKVRAKNMYI